MGISAIIKSGRYLKGAAIYLNRGLYGSFLWLCAFVLFVAIILQLMLWGAAGWLNTEPGQKWATAQMQEALSGSGYNMALGGYSYSFPSGLSVHDLALMDRQGVFAEIDRAAVRLSVLKLAARHVAFSLDAGQARLLRLPLPARKSSNEAGGTRPSKGRLGFALPSFSVPDNYIRAVTLARLDVKKLYMAPAVTGGQPVYFPVQLMAALDLEKDLIRLRLQGDFIGQEHKERSLAAVEKDRRPQILRQPHHIRAHMTLAPRRGVLDIKLLSVQAPPYSAHITGTAHLGAEQALDLTAQGRIDDMAAFADDLPGHVTFEGHVGGRPEQPVLSAEGLLVLDKLQQRGLAPLVFKIDTDAIMAKLPQGTIALATSYRQKDITLNADWRWQAPELSIGQINAAAPALALSGDMTLDTVQMLIDADMEARIDDLSIYQDLAGAPLGGQGHMAVHLSGKEGKQALTLDARLAEGRYKDIQAAHIDSEIVWPDIAALWPSFVAAQGRDLQRGRDHLAQLNVNLAPAPRALDAHDNRPEESFSQRYHAVIEGRGYVRQDLRFKGQADLTAMTDPKGPSFEEINFMLVLQDRDVNITGRYGPDHMDLTAQTQDFPVAAITAFVPEEPAFLQNLLLADGQLTLTGRPAQPQARTSLKLAPLRLKKNTPPITLTVKGTYADEELSLRLDGEGDAVERLSGHALLRAPISLQPWRADISEQTPIEGALQADFSVDSLAAALLPAVHVLTGHMKAEARLGGMAGTPEYNGNLIFTEGRYAYLPYDLRLFDVEATASYDGAVLRLEKLKAGDDAGGTLTAEGVIGTGSKVQDTAIDLQADNMALAYQDIVNGRFSSSLTFTGGPSYRLAGDIETGVIEVAIPERFDRDIPSLNIVERPGAQSDKRPAHDQSPVALDIQVQAKNQIFVRGWGLDAEMGGAVHIGGTFAQPLFDGAFNVLRGRYEEFGQRFTLTKAALSFQGSVPPSPYLDIVAETQAEDITAQILLRGAVSDPEITFASVPDYPEDEVLSRLLFGKDMSDISPFQAVQLAQTLRRYSGQGGGFDPLGQLRQATGLDDLRIEPDTEGQATIGAGKYLSDNVYLELESGSAEKSGAANLQIEVTPDITIESQIGQDAKAGGSVFWEWDY